MARIEGEGEKVQEQQSLEDAIQVDLQQLVAIVDRLVVERAIWSFSSTLCAATSSASASGLRFAAVLAIVRLAVAVLVRAGVL